MELEKLLRTFGDKWAEAGDSWMIVEGEKKKKKLIRWIIKKLSKPNERRC